MKQELYGIYMTSFSYKISVWAYYKRGFMCTTLRLSEHQPCGCNCLLRLAHRSGSGMAGTLIGVMEMCRVCLKCLDKLYE